MCLRARAQVLGAARCDPAGQAQGTRQAGWVLTGQVVFPHSICFPERPAVPAAASAAGAGPRPPALLYHLPAPHARRLGRHGSEPSRLGHCPCFPVRRWRAALCHVSSQDRAPGAQRPPQGSLGLVVPLWARLFRARSDWKRLPWQPAVPAQAKRPEGEEIPF